MTCNRTAQECLKSCPYPRCDDGVMPAHDHVSGYVNQGIVLVSGGFDPLHIGHVRLIEEAARTGSVVVALNSDLWLKRKKGFVFMPWLERREVLLALRHVADVVEVDDEDGSVAEAIIAVKPKFFANGGDRTEPNVYEAAACKRMDVKPLFNIGGGKIQSSSALTDKVKV